LAESALPGKEKRKPNQQKTRKRRHGQHGKTGVAELNFGRDEGGSPGISELGSWARLPGKNHPSKKGKKKKGHTAKCQGNIRRKNNRQNNPSLKENPAKLP